LDFCTTWSSVLLLELLFCVHSSHTKLFFTRQVYIFFVFISRQRLSRKPFQLQYLLRKLRNFKNKRKKEYKNALSIFDFLGLVNFHIRNASQICNKIMLQSCLASHHNFNQEKFYPQSTKITCPTVNKIWSYINTSMINAYAAVTIGTWAELPWDCRKKSINSSQSQFAIKQISTKIFPSKLYWNLSAKVCRTKMAWNFLKRLIFFRKLVLTFCARLLMQRSLEMSPGCMPSACPPNPPLIEWRKLTGAISRSFYCLPSNGTFLHFSPLSTSPTILREWVQSRPSS